MFAERLLREARAQASSGVIDLSPSIAGLPVASSVTASDSFPFITASGNGYRGTASLIRDYALGISGGTATIPENLIVSGNLTVNGNTTLGGDVTFAGPWQHPDVIAGTFTIAANHRGALLGPVGVSGTIDVAGTLAILA